MPDKWPDILVTWFDSAGRDLPWRRHRTPWRVWVAEIMLQQTQVVTGEKRYEAFLERFPGPAELARAPLDDVLKAWEGLGYYARARNLHRAAHMVVTEHDGVIPLDPDRFGRLPGVGPYVQAAFCSIVGAYPLPAVDGNVLRVTSRLFALPAVITRPATRTLVAGILRPHLPQDRPGAFNEALMELGATLCRPRHPDCRGCPVRAACLAHQRGEIDRFPVRGPRRTVPEREVAVAVLLDGTGRVLVQRRPTHGLLGGLWEFPGGKVELGETAEQAVQRECREELGAAIRDVAFLTRVRHTYSHFTVNLQVFTAWPDAPIPSAGHRRWVNLTELGELAVPAANQKVLPSLRQMLGGPPDAGQPPVKPRGRA